MSDSPNPIGHRTPLHFPLADQGGSIHVDKLRKSVDKLRFRLELGPLVRGQNVPSPEEVIMEWTRPGSKGLSSGPEWL